MEGGLLAEVLAYKASRGLPEVVTRRCVRLYASPARLAASTPAGDSGAASHNNGHEKAWLLDRACRLEPEYADEIVRQRCLLRPAGTWALAAKYLGSGACSDVQLVSKQAVPAGKRLRARKRPVAGMSAAPSDPQPTPAAAAAAPTRPLESTHCVPLCPSIAENAVLRERGVASQLACKQGLHQLHHRL